MPIKSKAQRRKFAELLVKGEITPEVYERWNREAGSAELPERLHPKGGARGKAKGKAKGKGKGKRRPKRATKRKSARAGKRRRPARRRG
jgi:hypothetical protein